MGSGLGRHEEDWKRWISWSCNTRMHRNNTRKLLYSHLYQKLAKLSCFSFYLLCFLFYKIGEQEVEQVLWGDRVGGWIWCKQCIHMYVNSKMIPVETVPGIGEQWKGDNSSMIYLIHCGNLCKCYNVPTPAQQF
jgi:hypothetical protein